MSDRIKKIKIKQQDGTFSDYIPIGADAENVEITNGENLSQRLVRIDEDLEKNEEDIAAAQSTANTARTSASNANTKIDGASIVGEYTSGTETLEILLELGEIQQKGE